MTLEDWLLDREDGGTEKSQGVVLAQRKAAPPRRDWRGSGMPSVRTAKSPKLSKLSKAFPHHSIRND